MEIIRDLLALWILGALTGTGYIVWALYFRDAKPAPGAAGGRPPPQITTRRTPVGPPPVARPAGSTPPVAQRTTPPPAGGEHQRRGSAPTVKLPAADPAARDASEDAAAADLFGGLSAAKAKADAAPPISVPAPPQLAIPKGIVEQAERIEERGFHVGAVKVETPAAARPATAGADGVPGQGRSQTAELDDILKRIDAVLSESNAPQSEATLSGQQGGKGSEQTMPLPQSPPTEKHDRRATDPSQQKLF